MHDAYVGDNETRKSWHTKERLHTKVYIAVYYRKFKIQWRTYTNGHMQYAKHNNLQDQWWTQQLTGQVYIYHNHMMCVFVFCVCVYLANF